MLNVITDMNFKGFLLHLSALYCVVGNQNPIYFYIDSNFLVALVIPDKKKQPVLLLLHNN